VWKDVTTGLATGGLGRALPPNGLDCEPGRSGNQFRDDLGRFDGRETLIQPLRAVSKALVVVTQQLQHGGVKVADSSVSP
jgi:hypothetical protein